LLFSGVSTLEYNYTKLRFDSSWLRVNDMANQKHLDMLKQGIEIVLMVETGLSPMQSIAASTSNAARALGLQDEIGTIEVGKCADLLIIDGDPLANIGVLTMKHHIRVVMQNGQVMVGNELKHDL
jgi:imidazolonepropionase-like amidohydrolase